MKRLRSLQIESYRGGEEISRPAVGMCAETVQTLQVFRGGDVRFFSRGVIGGRTGRRNDALRRKNYEVGGAVAMMLLDGGEPVLRKALFPIRGPWIAACPDRITLVYDDGETVRGELSGGDIPLPVRKYYDKLSYFLPVEKLFDFGGDIPLPEEAATGML